MATFRIESSRGPVVGLTLGEAMLLVGAVTASYKTALTLGGEVPADDWVALLFKLLEVVRPTA